MTAEFMECDTCRALPGTPPLCRGCLHNRALITALSRPGPAITLDQLEAAARAHDREESAYRGEPDPWGLPDMQDGEAELFASDRLSCMRLAFEAVGVEVEASGVDRAMSAMRIPADGRMRIMGVLRLFRSRGTVDPDAFRTLLEDLPGTQKHAAVALGVAVTEVRRMVGSGKVRVEPFLTRFDASLRAEFPA